MKALLEPEELHALPATSRWLKYCVPALLQLQVFGRDLPASERLKRLSHLNVIQQMGNLRSHPSIQVAVNDKGLEVHGWYYEIHTGKVEVYSSETGMFEEGD